jgi:cyclically-permuted mutarotase family protein
MWGSYAVMAQNKGTNIISWSVAARLPVLHGMRKQPGVAGPFTGQSNGVLLIAGGANFADGAMPWQGGKKLHRDEIYVLEKHGDHFGWIKPKTAHLRQKTAYGASVTVLCGIVCAGGETDHAADCKDVFMMRWDAKTHDVVFTPLPSLPFPIANAGMASIGNTVFLGGGESGGKPTNRYIALDLDDKNGQWQQLPPMPVAMSHSAVVIQSNGKYPCVYVIGGRSANLSGISTLHNCVFCYDPQQKKWISLAPVGNGRHTTTISAASAVPAGIDEILLIGGDKGDIFHRIETYNVLIARTKDDKEKDRLQAEKLNLLNHHPGFSRDVYLYNTKANTWVKTRALPFYGQVTTTAVLWDHHIFIPCGEIKPGLRTPDITMGTLNGQP